MKCEKCGELLSHVKFLIIHEFVEKRMEYIVCNIFECKNYHKFGEKHSLD